MKPTKVILFILFLTGINLFAQQREDYSKYPGYFNYKDVPGLKNAETLSEVYLEETLLKMVSGLTEENSDGIGSMIDGLKLIQVTEYKIDQMGIVDMESSLESIDNGMQSKNWDRIVRTKSRGNFTNIYIKKSSGAGFEGLTILSLSKKEKNEESGEKYGKLTCVNIVGKIDMSKIGKLTKELNIPGMDGLKEIDKAKGKK
ncbi:MAG: hypothetical protein CVV24_00235 [Ignavibacteriae bacterium HGW-Ignavibacteriae-3]|nr:MAG: hypothetical protein CVV24_00235 [Ignavibacteriae bacterium HGW-Ignavibacteriae-3]